MINMDIGIPINIAMDGNSYRKEGVFLTEAICIGDRLGIGRNLFSGKPTLIEKDGFEE